MGFAIDHVVADNGVSGISTRLVDRPEGRRLFDLLRAGDTLVVRWLDRLGRNYTDVIDTIREFLRRSVVIRTVIHNMTFTAPPRPRHRRPTGQVCSGDQVRQHSSPGTQVQGDLAHVAAACDTSLKRLGTDGTDLYFIHRVDDKAGLEPRTRPTRAVQLQWRNGGFVRQRVFNPREP